MFKLGKYTLRVTQEPDGYMILERNRFFRGWESVTGYRNEEKLQKDIEGLKNGNLVITPHNTIKTNPELIKEIL